jgi:hypothetical protein
MILDTEPTLRHHALDVEGWRGHLGGTRRSVQGRGGHGQPVDRALSGHRVRGAATLRWGASGAA